MICKIDVKTLTETNIFDNIFSPLNYQRVDVLSRLCFLFTFKIICKKWHSFKQQYLGKTVFY
jgi:hypothetical protein